MIETVILLLFVLFFELFKCLTCKVKYDKNTCAFIEINKNSRIKKAV